MVGAYTGMAASNVNGELICSRLGLSTSSSAARAFRKSGNIPKNDKKIKTLISRNGHLEYIIVDEAFQLGINILETNG